MRPHQFRHRTARTFFISPKCEMAIAVGDPLMLHALQQAALDRSVRSIHQQAGPEIDCPQVSLAGVVLDRVDGSFLLGVHETRPERSADEASGLALILKRHGLRLLERDATDIRQEPLFSNARFAWSFVHYHVPITDRLRIALALEDGGPQSVLELEERARPTCDTLAAVCALACQDLVGINISRDPLGPRTIVFAR
ncbi:hypothetical protein JOE51_004146 [Bradyrhizobium japonicum]|uniref:Uncharacterized protein n=1 Tax=Bradyrhizobium diazoefficiens TaxID=1355477 RepID=A0A809Y4I3_9BRAD|nr:hypothetical protein [Bradyrhizobium japonicum]BCE33630.1 hypothetical protein XF2B_73990 [Bradyrhizobium diazoefficiens]BCF20707.1 hypothetical protein XF13B_73980 [Bradyrhizobium diazoefficiens]